MAKMLTHKAAHIWSNKPKLSRVFWAFTALIYLSGLLAIAAILVADYDALQRAGTVGERVVFHLSFIRLTFISVALIVFAFLLFTSLQRLFYFLVGVTAWVVMIYVDDMFVLYRIIQYPQAPIINMVFALRPVVIIGLIWMCFELNLRLRSGSETS
jgi:sensor histidine kinase YesM